MPTENSTDEGIAIIGMAGRFPGANTIADFWQNLKNGVCSVTRYADEELAKAGVDAEFLKNPSYVKSGSQLGRIDLFDAGFFGYTPREAELLDPQHRLFLECAWESFECAGYDPETYSGLIGLFAGCGNSNYLIKNILPGLGSADLFQLMLDNEKDYLTTRVSYKLNLRGPSVNIQSACSTSLVAVCIGCQNLLTYQCDMALCGGVSLILPHGQGYLYKEGFINSADGVCRAFDAKANGTVQGEGAGVVVLKRLEDAVRDGDTIRSVIKGIAFNNDGAIKAGFTAPSVDGQARAITLAQEMADVHPDSISYIETHGTGTVLGDPIEFAALTKAFRAKTKRKNFCAIGSVKTNIGHLDAAAGVAGLIKATLALEHKQLPPSLHFTNPNPMLTIEDSPFFVNTNLASWETTGAPRRAGVSSFGIGGTNAHVVLEEAPEQTPSSPHNKPVILTLSAKNDRSLREMKTNLVAYLKANPSVNLSDVAYTLQTGRKPFEKRMAVIGATARDIITSIEKNDPRDLFSTLDPAGQGSLPDGRNAEASLHALGKRWVGGAYIDWRELYKNETRRRMELPSYAFDRSRYFIEPTPEKTNDEKRDNNAGNSTFANISPYASIAAIEAAMTKIWSDFFGIPAIAATDNFFDLGGDSLKITQLLVEITTVFNQTISTADLFNYPTIKEISAFIESNNRAATSKTEPTVMPILFPVQRKGKTPPLFIVGGAHENQRFDPVRQKSSYEEYFLHYLGQLISFIGSDQQIYAFRPKGLENEIPHATVEEMATAYIQEMRKIQPQGPYLIAGNCIGGLVTYEMVQQLIAAGQQIYLHFMMDTHCTSMEFYFREKIIAFRKWLGDLRHELYKDFIKDWWLAPSIFFPVTPYLRKKRKLLFRSYAYKTTLLKYKPKPCDVKMVLFVNEEWHKKEPNMGWNPKLFPHLEIVAVPGDHSTSLTTYGDIYGEKLRELIKKSVVSTTLNERHEQTVVPKVKSS
jgi:3-oxoacyl-(acyl-carrier-protein) synthase/acyl carrier protein